MPPALVDNLTFTRAFRELYVTNIVIQYYDRLLLVQLSQMQPYRCLPRRQYVLRLSPTPASTHSYAIPRQKHQLPDRDLVLDAGESTPSIANRFHRLLVGTQF
jgi:hypothetical protein